VLYLHLDGGLHSFQHRMNNMLRADAEDGRMPDAPEDLHVVHSGFPRLDEGGLALLDEWTDRKPSTRLIVVDMLVQVKPQSSGYRNAYDEDYEALDPLRKWATDAGVSLLLVHHTNKRGAGTISDLISGTNAIGGAPENLMMLHPKDPNTAEHDGSLMHADLKVVPRDGPHGEHHVALDPRFGLWKMVQDVEGKFPKLSGRKKRVAEYLDTKGERTPQEIADALNDELAKVKRALRGLFQSSVAKATDPGEKFSAPWTLIEG
jgi:hypothetical protein